MNIRFYELIRLYIFLYTVQYVCMKETLTVPVLFSGGHSFTHLNFY